MLYLLPSSLVRRCIADIAGLGTLGRDPTRTSGFLGGQCSDKIDVTRLTSDAIALIASSELRVPFEFRAIPLTVAAYG